MALRFSSGELMIGHKTSDFSEMCFLFHILYQLIWMIKETVVD